MQPARAARSHRTGIPQSTHLRWRFHEGEATMPHT
jgi:3-methyladenine DNA glycosylase Mpg